MSKLELFDSHRNPMNPMDLCWMRFGHSWIHNFKIPFTPSSFTRVYSLALHKRTSVLCGIREEWSET